MPSQPCRIIVVTGATGSQGGAVIDTLLNSPPSFPIHIRGTTRNTSSPASAELVSRGVEMVEADFDDVLALSKAFTDAWAIFAVTDFWEQFSRDPSNAAAAKDQECRHGTNLAHAAAEIDTLEHYIWSTEPDSRMLSRGKYNVPHFDGKAYVDDIIRTFYPDSLYRKTTFLWVSFYAKNLQYLPMWKPIFDIESGKYSVGVPVDPEARFASLGSLRNVGLAVAAVLDADGGKSQQSSQLVTSVDLPRRQARYIPVNCGFFSLREYYETWADVVLKSSCDGDGTDPFHQNGDAHLHLNGTSLPNGHGTEARIEVKKIDASEYEKLYGGFGKEMCTMFEFWRDMGDEGSWTVGDCKGDIGSEDAGVVFPLQELLSAKGQRVVNLKESFRELVWDCHGPSVCQ